MTGIRRGVQNSSDYPKAPVQIVDIPVWKDEDVEAYIKERVKLHKKSKLLSDIGDELPLCTDEERWKKPTKYAVMKKGAKRAVKLFDDLDTANTVCAENNKEGSFYVEKRVGEAIRCTGNYCGSRRMVQSIQQRSYCQSRWRTFLSRKVRKFDYLPWAVVVKQLIIAYPDASWRFLHTQFILMGASWWKHQLPLTM